MKNKGAKGERAAKPAAQGSRGARAPKGAAAPAAKAASENSLAPVTGSEVSSGQSQPAHQPVDNNAPAGPAGGSPVAEQTLTLKRSTSDRKDKRLVIYNIEGRTGSVQFLSTLFGGSQTDQGNPPETLRLVGEFAEPKAAKPKETPAERKARLAAETPEQKIARAEARVAKLREKLQKATQAAPAA